MLHLLLAGIYLAFISLGLPDSLLGSAWPTMYRELSVPLSYAGGISMTIAVCTVISSLLCERVTKRFSTGVVTAVSVLTTAVALFGFSVSRSYAALCLWAVPYGLGAGCVDAALNNYVALHYASRHMNWLHCMWGVGASLGPYVMGFALSGNKGWGMGYRYIALFQFALTAVLLLGLPLWKKAAMQNGEAGTDLSKSEPVSLLQALRIPGARAVMTTFFCYCAIEQTAGLWAGSFLVLKWGLAPEDAAGFAGLFYIGITLGRAVSGFIAIKLNDTQLIRMGQSLILLGIILLLLPLGGKTAMVGLVLAGLGCAPIYPSIIHSTPEHFGADKSQAMVGIQMASAYVGTCLMPPVFGFVANHVDISLFPVYLLLLLAMMIAMHEKLLRQTKKLTQ